MPEFPRDDYAKRRVEHGPAESSPAPPEPAPVEAANPWAGVHLVTAHDPAVALPLCPWVDCVWLKGDGGDRVLDPAIPFSFLRQSVRVVEWWSWDLPTARPPFLLPIIAQAEGPQQREWCETNELRATVTNVTFTEEAWLSRYEAVFTECYENVNPAATQLALEYESVKRGARFVVPTYATYDGSSERADGRKVPLAEYLGRHRGDSFAVYLAEYMDAADVAALKAWREEHPKP